MVIVKTSKGKEIKITKQGVFYKIFGKWDKYPAFCQHKNCIERADNLYWHEAVLCPKHYQINK